MGVIDSQGVVRVKCWGAKKKCYILNTYGFRDEDFLSLSHNKSMGAIGPNGVASFDPRGLIGRMYVGGARHCYILNIKAVYSNLEAIKII